MRISLPSYGLFSTAAVVGLFLFALAAREGFLSVLLFLTNARISIAILMNFALVMGFRIGRAATRFFLGTLRELEIEQVYEAAGGFLMDTVMFLVLTSPTVDGEETSTGLLLRYVGFVVTTKIFHLLAQVRVVHIFDSGFPRPNALFRLFCLMLILLSLSCVSVVVFLRRNNSESSMFLWLLFESVGMVVSGLANVARFFCYYVDAQLENGWPSKNSVIFCIDVLGDVATLTSVLIFMFLFIVNFPTQLPIHTVAHIIQLARTLVIKLRSFQRCRVLVNEMATRFPEATFEELEEADTCIICRDILHEGSRKLPCSHIFHIDCLKAWFVQQQTCPTCRCDVFTRSTTATPTAPATTEGPTVPDTAPTSAPTATAAPEPSAAERAGSPNEPPQDSPRPRNAEPGGSLRSSACRAIKCLLVLGGWLQSPLRLYLRYLRWMAPDLMGADSAEEDMIWRPPASAAPPRAAPKPKPNRLVDLLFPSGDLRTGARRPRRQSRDIAIRSSHPCRVRRRKSEHLSRRLGGVSSRRGRLRNVPVEVGAEFSSQSSEIEKALEMSEFYRNQAVRWLTEAHRLSQVPQTGVRHHRHSASAPLLHGAEGAVHGNSSRSSDPLLSNQVDDPFLQAQQMLLDHLIHPADGFPHPVQPPSQTVNSESSRVPQTRPNSTPQSVDRSSLRTAKELLDLLETQQERANIV